MAFARVANPVVRDLPSAAISSVGVLPTPLPAGVELRAVVRRNRVSRRWVYLIALCLFAMTSTSESAHALCCKLPSGSCAPAADNVLSCLLAHGTSELDRVCTASGCVVPTPPPDVTGCCDLPIFGCTVNRPAACQSLHGAFYPDRRCTLWGCVPANIPPTPTRTSTARSTSSRTPTITASATRTRTNSPVPTSTTTATATPTYTPTQSRTPTATSTPTQSATVTASDTATSTASATPTITPVPTLTNTATSTATATDTFAPTDTPTPADTETPTDTPTITPTPTPGGGWIFCANEGGTCELPPGGRIVRYADFNQSTAQFVSGASIDCNNDVWGDPDFVLGCCAVTFDTPYGCCPERPKHCDYYNDVLTEPIARAIVDAGMDAEETVALPPHDQNRQACNPGSPEPPWAVCSCPAQNPSSGGCVLQNSMDGGQTNYIDASASVDPRVADQSNANLSFKWEILLPPTVDGGNHVYTNGVTGYLAPVLTFAPSSLPDFGTDAGTDPFWRVRLTITEGPLPGDDSPLGQTVVYFRFKYQDSQVSYEMYRDCQTIGYVDGNLCTSDGQNVLPTSEAH